MLQATSLPHEQEHFAALEKIGTALRQAMRDAAANGLGDQQIFGEARQQGGFGRIEDVVERARFAEVSIDAVAAEKLEPQVLVIDANFAAILARDIGALIEVKWFTAGVAIRLGMGFEGFEANRT